MKLKQLKLIKLHPIVNANINQKSASLTAYSFLLLCERPNRVTHNAKPITARVIATENPTLPFASASLGVSSNGHAHNILQLMFILSFL